MINNHYLFKLLQNISKRCELCN